MIDPSDDLEYELACRCAEMPRSALDLLAAMGVDARFALALNSAGSLAVGKMTIEADGARWTPGGPDQRLLLAVREGGGLVDVLALSSSCRNEWALRRGDGVMLGFDLWAQAQCGAIDRLRVFSTPFDWMAAQGEGICVLDWTAEALGMLRGLGPKVVLRTDHGAKEKLRNLLQWGGLPRVESVAGVRRMAA